MTTRKLSPGICDATHTRSSAPGTAPTIGSGLPMGRSPTFAEHGGRHDGVEQAGEGTAFGNPEPVNSEGPGADTLESAEEVHGDGEAAYRLALASLKHSFEKVGDPWEPKDDRVLGSNRMPNVVSKPAPVRRRQLEESTPTLRRPTSSISPGDSTSRAARA